MQAGLAEWTILVFLNAKNNLEKWSFPNFAQMASVGSTDAVNVVVQFGRPRQHYTEDFGGWSKTLRFRVKPGTTPTEDQALMDLGAANMGDPATLIEFVRWGRATFPARRTMLVIWNHGQGWRVRGAQSGQPAPEHDDGALDGAIRYVSNDEDTGDKLYNRAIQDALLAHLVGERLDIVAFDACLMAMVETAYAFRDVSRVLIGSEELEPGSGWDYERWLRPLVADPAVDARRLGELVVQAYASVYGDLDLTTQSAIDLDKIAALSSAISAFAETAIPLLVPANAEAFRSARAACLNYAPGKNLHSIDLGRYMQQIEGSDLDPALRRCAAEVRARLQDAVIANYASARRQGKYGSHGLAIYFPDCSYAFQSDPDGDGYDLDNHRFPVEFVQREKWAAFLHKYWALFP